MSGTSAALTLVDLPHDILIHVCTQLDTKAFLAFIQTCRVLHAFASSDYVWHRIRHDLPLDLSSSRDGRLCNIPASELQAISMRALRLNDNWQQQNSRVLAISKIRSSHMVVEMQPLGSSWLVTSHRVRSNLVDICIWRLGKDIPASCVIRIELETAFSFKAAFEEEGGDIAIISVLGAPHTDHTKGQLIIYQVNLKGHQTNENPLGVPYLMSTRKIERSAVFYHVQISGEIVAAAIVNLVNGPLHQILLFNIQTKVLIVVDSPILSAFDPAGMQYKLYPPYIVVVGAYKGRIKAHVRELPTSIFLPCAGEDTVEDWAASVVDYETAPMRNIDIYVSPEPIYRSPLTSFSVMAAYSPFSSAHAGIAHVYHFPVDTSARDLAFTDWRPTFTFNTPANVTLEPTCLGKTGARAVWLSHQWNSDEYQLMRGSFPDKANGKAVILPLSPPDLPLPFEPHTCRSLYFDEAAGKVWVGVHTGDIYAIQF